MPSQQDIDTRMGPDPLKRSLERQCKVPDEPKPLPSAEKEEEAVNGFSVIRAVDTEFPGGNPKFQPKTNFRPFPEPVKKDEPTIKALGVGTSLDMDPYKSVGVESLKQID